jgi:cysteinyl-tRNA synthetase
MKKQVNELDKSSSDPHLEYVTKFTSAVEDDLDTPQALALAWDLLKDDSVSSALKRATILNFDKVLGLNLEADILPNSTDISSLPDDIQNLLRERELARTKKDWSRSDDIRDELSKLGYSVEDHPEGPSVSPSSSPSS